MIAALRANLAVEDLRSTIHPPRRDSSSSCDESRCASSAASHAKIASGWSLAANPVTDYGAKTGEGFPEALAFFYTDPSILQATRPATFAFMQANKF